MVDIEEVMDDDAVVPGSEERSLDADEIERVMLASVKRPMAKMRLEALVKSLRKEAEALKRVEASQNAANTGTNTSMSESAPAVAETTTTPNAPAVAVPTASSAAPQPKTVTPKTEPAKTLPPLAIGAKYVPIDTFAFDSGGYSSSHLTIYVSSLDGIKEIPREDITCDFTSNSFDLIVRNLKGKSYRLFKDELAHDIDPSTSKIIVKKDRVVIKLGKVKGEYGYDTWTDLIDKKKLKKSKSSSKDDPHSSIMNLMKDMYESGDDNMRKIIGETMEKQRRGELGKDSPSLSTDL